MALDFPSNPDIGDRHTAVNGIVYEWDGDVWVIVRDIGKIITDHTLLDNIGTNTHDQIDTHIVDGTTHFTQAAISITENQISDLDSYLTDITGESLGDLADVDVSGSPPASENQVLMKSASDWIATSDLTNIKIVGYEEVVNIDNDGVFDFTSANFFVCVPTGDITIAPVMGSLSVMSATIHIDNTAAAVITMPTNTEWVGGDPTLGTKYVFTLYTLDSGTIWYAVYIGDLS